MNKYQAILFDLDGTLLNTLEDLYLSTNYALAYYGYKPRTKEEVRCFVGNGVKVLIDKAAPKDCDNLTQVLDTFKAHYEKHATDHIEIYDGILELLKELKQRNIKIGVVTNKFEEAAKIIVNNYFGDMFDVIVGERKELNKKPAADMCNYAINLLKVEKEKVLYIGDSEVDIKTAENTHLPYLSVSWGFRTKEELKKAQAKIIINKPKEVLQYI